MIDELDFARDRGFLGSRRSTSVILDSSVWAVLRSASHRPFDGGQGVGCV